MKCYASIIGGCSDKQSKEHYLSKGLWKDKIVTFEGLPWLRGEKKSLPAKSVALKILCTTHNSLLSELDDEGITLFQTTEKFHQNQFLRGKLKKSAIWKTDRAVINGRKLERLIAKIAVGYLQEYPEATWHLTGNKAIDPPKEIIEVIYGQKDFESPRGLYSINTIGDNLHNQERVRILPLFHPETNGYLGCIISFRDWQFFINLSGISLKEYTLRSATGANIGKDGLASIYQPKGFNFNVGKNAGGKLSGKITFDW